LPVLVTGILDLRDDLFNESSVFDGLGMQTLAFARFDLFQVVFIQAHDDPGVLVLFEAWLPDRREVWRAGTG
jgi:hypothetical protein